MIAPTMPPPDDESMEPRVVYQNFGAFRLIGGSAANPAPGASQPLQRVHRVRVLSFSAPMLVVEATPAAARDIQEIPGVKQIEPSPEECEPDRFGGVYFSLILSLLYDAHAIIAEIERYDQLDPLPVDFLSMEDGA